MPLHDFSRLPDAPLGFIHLQEQQTANTNGGTSTAGSWQTRVLNTEVTDTGSDCSLASNQFTLRAGTYYVNATAPFLWSQRTQLRIQNTTDAATLVLGTTQWGTASTSDGQSVAGVFGFFTVGAGKACELQYQIEAARVTYGLGYGVSWGTNVYGNVLLIRLA